MYSSSSQWLPITFSEGVGERSNESRSKICIGWRSIDARGVLCGGSGGGSNSGCTVGLAACRRALFRQSPIASSDGESSWRQARSRFRFRQAAWPARTHALGEPGISSYTPESAVSRRCIVCITGRGGNGVSRRRCNSTE